MSWPKHRIDAAYFETPESFAQFSEKGLDMSLTGIIAGPALETATKVESTEFLIGVARGMRTVDEDPTVDLITSIKAAHVYAQGDPENYATFPPEAKTAVELGVVLGVVQRHLQIRSGAQVEHWEGGHVPESIAKLLKAEGEL